MAEHEAKKRKRLSEEVEEEIGAFSDCMENIRTHTDALINIVANPSLKVSKDNQKKIRRVISVIME